MNILKLEVTNVKKLKAISVSLKPGVNRFTGKNGAGKSSALDSFIMLLGGKDAFTAAPVRRGAQQARIRGDFGEIIVTRKWNASGTTDVIVEAPSGARFSSPQRLLDSLYGDLTFDPQAFDRMKPAEQVELLRRLVPLDVDVDALDRENARDYELRTGWNHRAKAFQERVATVREGIDESIDVTPIDVSDLLAELQRATDHNAAIERDERDRLRWSLERETRLSDAALARQEAARLIAKAERLESEADELQQRLGDRGDTQAAIDVSALRQRIDEAAKMNVLRDHQARQRAQFAAAEAELAGARKEAEVLTKRMEARIAAKADALARAAMPVPGLSFDAGQVLYNGLPYSEASSAERIRISFALAMAANPKLKVVLIRDGSLLDDDSLAIIAEMAEANAYQVIMEAVSSDGTVGIHLVDGEVAAIDGEPVEPEPQTVSA